MTKLDGAIRNLAVLRAEYDSRGESRDGWCQRFNRIACERAGLRVPHADTALDACRELLAHPGDWPWAQVHGIGTAPGAFLVYFTGGAKTKSGVEPGHVVIVTYTKAGNGRVVGVMHDNLGDHRLTRGWAARIRAAFAISPLG